MLQLFARAGFWHLPALPHLATRTQIVARRQGRIALAQPTAAKAFLVARKVALTAPEKSRDKFMETIGNDKGQGLHTLANSVQGASSTQGYVKPIHFVHCDPCELSKGILP
jgi:hypothetical protein